MIIIENHLLTISDIRRVNRYSALQSSYVMRVKLKSFRNLAHYVYNLSSIWKLGSNRARDIIAGNNIINKFKVSVCHKLAIIIIEMENVTTSIIVTDFGRNQIT